MSLNHHKGSGMKFFGVLMAMGMLLGCVGSARGPARDVGHGLVDAFVNPDPRNELAVKINRLVDKYVETALKAGPPPGVEQVTRDVTEGVIKAVALHTPEERALVRAVVHDAASEALRAVKEEVPSPDRIKQSGAALGRGLVESVTLHEDDILRVLAQSGGVAGKSLIRATSGELVEQLTTNLGENSPLSTALATSTERATSAVVRGMTNGLASELEDCTSNDPAQCKADFVRRLSRSAAMGFTEGVGRKLDIWELVLAAIGGVVLALGANWMYRRITQDSSGYQRVRVVAGPGLRRRVRRS